MSNKQIRLIELWNRFVKVQEKGNLRIHEEVEITNTTVMDTDNNIGKIVGINEHGEEVTFLTTEIQYINFLDTKEQAILRSSTRAVESYKEAGLDKLPEDHPAYEIVQDVFKAYDELTAKGVQPYQSVRG